MKITKPTKLEFVRTGLVCLDFTVSEGTPSRIITVLDASSDSEDFTSTITTVLGTAVA